MRFALAPLVAPRAAAVAVLAAFAVLASGDGVAAQSAGAVSVVVGSDAAGDAPHVGAGLYGLPETGVGLYANVHSATSAGATEAGPGYALNVGVTRPVTDGLALYAGVGVGQGRGTQDGGLFRAAGADDEGSGGSLGANVNVGALISSGSLSVDAGFNTALDQGYLGVGFRF